MTVCDADIGVLQIASILCLVYSHLSLAARLTVKWDLLFYDDAVLGAAYVSSPFA